MEFPTPLATAIALGPAAILFREDLIRSRPKSAHGYRLKCRELSLWFPIEGETKRYDGRLSADRFFKIQPFEAPLVPLDCYYELEWLDAGGHPIETKQEDPVRVSFPHPTRVGGSASNVALHARLKLWREDGAVLFDRAGRPKPRPDQPTPAKQSGKARSAKHRALPAQESPPVSALPGLSASPEQEPPRALLGHGADQPTADPAAAYENAEAKLLALEKLTASLPAGEQASWIAHTSKLRQQLNGQQSEDRAAPPQPSRPPKLTRSKD